MKKLVFDKQEVVHIDSVTAVDTMLGFKGGNPVVTIFFDKGYWHYYGSINNEPVLSPDWPDIKDIINALMQRDGITEFYVV